VRAGGEGGVPAVAPDGVLAVDRVTIGLVAAGVHDLEVVDEAVGLVEVTVEVEIVTVVDVERREVGLDLGQRLTAGDLVGNRLGGPSRTRNHVLLQTFEEHGKPLERPYWASLKGTFTQTVTTPSTL
jgi:hypothetical protein